jgi:multidrug efflux pump
MLLSDISIKRPVFASVISLLLLAFGVLAFERLALREYPDIDPPIVSVRTDYPGASAAVVESRVTQLIEDRVSGVEGIKFIQSRSRDGRSDITIEFNLGRDMESAANDVRDRVSRVLDDLPEEAQIPDIQKVDSNDNVIMWLNLTSTEMTLPELTDYADRYLLDRFSVVDGVARVRIGGGLNFAMRVWLDRKKMAAYQLTVSDVERALRAENVELPAGSIESIDKNFSVRVQRNFETVEDFRSLALTKGSDGYVVRLADIARVELGTEEDRLFFRGNGEAMVGIGITKQSTANTIDVARAAKAAAAQINPTLPEGMNIRQSYDSSVFIEEAVKEVYQTLAIAIALVIFVIYLFLGSARAMLVPAITVPVSLISTFILLSFWGFSLNILTLLALVLAIGLVVDDAIVVLENIHRRIEEYGESPLVAAFRGTRQVGFAVVATTLVLIAVFAPIAVLQGDMGRLFSEFALTMTAAVIFSSLVALTASAMIASKLLKHQDNPSAMVNVVDRLFDKFRARYKKGVVACLSHPVKVFAVLAALIAAMVTFIVTLPNEFAPKEDRGAFFVIVNGPEGASFKYIEEYMNEIEERLMPMVDSGEAQRVLVRAPRSFGGSVATFNTGMVIVVLNPSWDDRRSAFEIMDEVRANLSDLPGVRAFPIMRQGVSSNVRKPVEITIGGGTFDEMAQWQAKLFEEIEKNNPGLEGLDSDYKPTTPQVHVEIDYDRAAELGVSVQNIGRTLQTVLGSKRVTTYLYNGEEYDVIVQGERSQQNSPSDLTNIYVRSDRTGELIELGSVLKAPGEAAVSQNRNRYNRTRAITIEANLSNGLTLGEALEYLEGMIDEHLPEHVIVDYKGESQKYKYSGNSVALTFGLGILVMFLVMAAQFESYMNPFIILLTVPVAITGGLFGIWVTGGTLNLYSQIGLIMLIGLAAKNGILIVEFANQLRNEGRSVFDAIVEASEVRLRPIVMTSITTVAGSIPLILSSGAGSETRQVLGTTLFFGVIAAAIFTIFIVPVAYNLLARFTTHSNAVTEKLESEMQRGSSLDSAP